MYEFLIGDKIVVFVTGGWFPLTRAFNDEMDAYNFAVNAHKMGFEVNVIVGANFKQTGGTA